MKSGNDFVEDITKLRPHIYCCGELVTDVVNHPLLRPMINTAKATYDLALDPENAHHMTATSPLTNKTCNLLSTLLEQKEDLVRTVKQRRWWHNTVGTCNAGRCAGTCVANAIFHGTYVLDEAEGTDYHQKFKQFFKTVHEQDKICSAGVMCVKGDRSTGPSGQVDPDLYVRVVKQDAQGIVVRGAKAHQSNGALAHEILVLPCRPMGAEEKEYAVSFAVQNGSKGLIHVWQHSLHDSRRLVAKDMDLGSGPYGLEYHGTCLTIFDDVFIPWDRVFMCGEYQHSSTFVEKFSDLIRMCGGGCRAGAVDLAIGTMGLLAEYNGLEKASHIAEKLVNITQMNETGYGCALAAAHEGEKARSGLTFPNSLHANAARLNGSMTFAEAHKWLGDIAGGLIATLPSESDFANQDIGPMLDKYLKGNPHVATKDRVKAIRFAEMLGAGPVLHGLICGGGTPETQKMVIRRHLDLDRKKNLVRKLATIETAS